MLTKLLGTACRERCDGSVIFAQRQGKTAIVGLRVSEGGCVPAPEWVQALYVAASLSAQLADGCDAVYVCQSGFSCWPCVLCCVCTCPIIVFY